MKFSQTEKTEGFQHKKNRFWEICVRILYDGVNTAENKDNFIFGLHPKDTPNRKLQKVGVLAGKSQFSKSSPYTGTAVREKCEENEIFTDVKYFLRLEKESYF